MYNSLSQLSCKRTQICRLKTIDEKVEVIVVTAILLADFLKGDAAYVFLDEIEAAIVGHKSSNLLAILDELNSRTLPDS